jgi:DNA-binding transcriptional MerR regulator
MENLIMTRPNWAIETLVSEEVYTDRQEFLDYLYQTALKAKTRRTGSTVLLGQRRMGKTELFKRVVNRLFFEQDHEEPNAVVPVYYSFPDTFKSDWNFSIKYVENFIRWYVAFRLRQPEILQATLDYDELIAIAREKLSVTKGFQIALNFLVSLQKQKITSPEQEALYLPRRVAAYDDSTIVMFLDEFQNTRLPQHNFDVVGYMQEAVESPTCPHFVTGSSMSILAREILGRGALFGRFESHPIEPLTCYWGTELVRKAASYYDTQVADPMAAVIAERCGGNPFYITALIKQAVKLNKPISSEEILNQILAIDLSSGFIWTELSDQVTRWLERINEYGITKWILYLSAIQEGEKIDLTQIQQALLEQDYQTVSLEQIREVLIKLSRGDLLDYLELGNWFRKVKDPILLEFLRVWGRIAVEGKNEAEVKDELQQQYQSLQKRVSDLKGYLAEVYMAQILFNAQEQSLPGTYFHVAEAVNIPGFNYIRLRERLGPGAQTEIDLHGAAGIEQWVAESKWRPQRKASPKEIQELLDKAEVVKKDRKATIMRLWFFSYHGFTQKALDLMSEQGILWSTQEDLDGLLDYVKLRRLPELS